MSMRFFSSCEFLGGIKRTNRRLPCDNKIFRNFRYLK